MSLVDRCHNCDELVTRCRCQFSPRGRDYHEDLAIDNPRYADTGAGGLREQPVTSEYLERGRLSLPMDAVPGWDTSTQAQDLPRTSADADPHSRADAGPYAGTDPNSDPCTGTDSNADNVDGWSSGHWGASAGKGGASV